ncbi:MAG: phosphate ABC transporter permease PstA [Oscillospiraceae bacterium]
MKKAKIQSAFLKGIVFASVGITITALTFIIGYILIKGVPHLSLDLFSIKYTSENVSLFPSLINTITMTALSLLIAVPLGVFSAIYLVEYAKRGNKLVAIVRTTTETLSGIPSIVYGLFGYLLFVVYLGWGYSILAGAVTLSIMILPVIMRTTEEALKSISDSFREGSYGLGAGKLRTVFKIVLPSAVPGILAGIVLSVGRIVGETAALIYTAGTVAQIPNSLFGSGRTMSIHMYALWKEGFNPDESYATAVVLLIIVIGLNALSAFIAKRISKGKTSE